MNLWQRLKNNHLALLGIAILTVLYVIVIAADFVAPYNPYSSQLDGSLLPPTPIYLTIQDGPLKGRYIGPHVYPASQSPTNIETGKRNLNINFHDPSPIRLFVKGNKYKLLNIRIPLPPSFEEVELFSGIPIDIHLIGTLGTGKLNLLGTDEQGRDQFSRLLFGGRVSLFIGLLGIMISFPIGIVLGGISGYFGGWIDVVLMRLVEVLMTIPGIYLLVALATIIPPSLSNTQRFILIILITSFIGWSGLARVVRGQVLSFKDQEFVQAAKAMGATNKRIILHHILPQTATYIVISATLTVPEFIVSESVLSLIGLGIQQPDASWGNLLSVSTNASILVLQPWLIWPPALAIILTVLSFNLLGDGLRDALDPNTFE
ncbi:MAG: ABC transporter permease [Candidatus Atelocyanobacterium thalassa]|uniref:ABC-type dipeptide/oligopeptide/nickel transport system, permease component n=1 Tax=Candidatus Atelocyanobacterium thalassa isolate SIO64986 TaxID=1527444 RepID=A0A086CGF6_9CHRO|nr:MAG: ABC-type dipeptide/oligopeptide/nickel transport system, permease component [Candidatus Atelocyanobacterium thalassa isolate SIO64986]